MSVTAAMIATLRRMVGEPNGDNGYDFDTLSGLIGEYPLIDEQGEPPYTLDVSTSPPSQDANEDWIATYDLHAAAARVWEEKASSWADKYDFSADGGQFVRHQAYDQCMQMARYHHARRSARTITAHKWPIESANSEWIANQVDDLR